jgi:hypothetical protein
MEQASKLIRGLSLAGDAIDARSADISSGQSKVMER